MNFTDHRDSRGSTSDIIKTFGLGVYLRSLTGGKKSLLDQMVDKYLSAGIAMPGRLGNAYKLSALIEFRVARVYAQLAERFVAHPVVRDFFLELQQEEEEHGRLMVLCLYTVKFGPQVTFVPGIEDREIKQLLKRLRELEDKAATLSLDEALDITESLEKSEINITFERLIKQADQPENRFFIQQLAKAEGHSTAVPKRIKKIKEQLAAQ